MTTPIIAVPHALRPRPVERRVALFDLGFRPFFLLAAAFGACAVPLWLLALRGGLEPGGAFGALQWHAHEMIFGFTTAVIAGFLLTATSNWTGRPTLKGPALAALAALWLLGRAGVFLAGRAPKTAAFIDVAFLPLLALACAVPLFAVRNRHGYGFVVLLGALAVCNAAVHAAAMFGHLALVSRLHVLALDIVATVMVIITGRIVPNFTRNATTAAGIERNPLLERSALAAVLAVAVSDGFAAAPAVRAALALLAAFVVGARMRRWGSWSARRDPLLWILHVGSAWLPLGLALRAASLLTSMVPAGSALHALTAGAIGSLTLGMMARVSLGHTGRMLRASRAVVIAFALVVTAGLLRVSAPFLPSARYLALLDVAGTFWTVAFGLFCVSHWRMLLAPRVDGR
jgi:uncharacterized protein involved in response to NO